MISYEILETVTARQGDWVATLTPQQQLLLARLVYAKGAGVRKYELQRVIWDQGMVPDGAVRRLVYEVRGVLRDAVPDSESVVSNGDVYRLPLEDRQVDALRFAAKLEEADNSAGAEQARLTREALEEWGPRASGLFGGYPLLGLDGSWAHATRRKLRTRYRDAVIDSLRRDAAAEDYASLLGKCARLAADDREDLDRKAPQDAMRDNDFLVLWMLAAYRSDQPERAEEVLRQAADAATRSGRPVSADLQRRAQQMRDEASRPRAYPSAAGARPTSLASDRRTMNEPTIIFNNNSGSVITSQIAVAHGVTINASGGSATEILTAGADESAAEPDWPMSSTGADGSVDE